MNFYDLLRKPKLNLLYPFCAVLLVASSSAYAKKEYNHFLGPISEKLENTQVLAFVEEAFVSRGWRIIESADKFVSANIDHRGVKAAVTIKLDEGQLSYSCEGTRYIEKLKTNGGGTGFKKIKKTINDYCPERWINNLRSDITRSIKIEAL